MKETKPFEEITIWERLNVKENIFEHNHINEGWSGLEAPLPKNQKQAKNWKGAKWKKKYGYLQEHRVVEFGGKVLGEEIVHFKVDKPFNCLDCFKDTSIMPDDYWIQNDLWLSVVPEWVGHLCLRCLRIRLDRDLQLTDFMLDYEVNNHINQELLERVNS